MTTDIKRVFLSPAAAAIIRQEAMRSADGNETGGLLLGRIEPDGTAHVRHAAGPGPAAVHRPAFFLRDLFHAQRAAADAFALDGSMWIGEWHTHPGTAPAPSSQDLRTYLGFLEDPELGFDVFIAIILINRTGTWNRPEGHAWICHPTTVENVPLTVAPHQHDNPAGEVTTTERTTKSDP